MQLIIAQMFAREITVFLQDGMGFFAIDQSEERGGRGWGERKKDKSSEIQKYFSFGEDIRPF